MKKNEFDQPIGHTLPAWQPAKKPNKKSLIGSYCLLDVIDPSRHAKTLFEVLGGAHKGWTYLPYGPFNSYEDFNSWLKKIVNADDPFLYAILDKKNNQPIGIAGYLHIIPEHGSIEVGHLHFSNPLKQTPAATEAMYLMMYNAFENLHYRRYEWKCDSLNQPSQNAALRLGFKFEGIFRQHMVYKKRNRDTAWFSILDHEWPQLKIKFEKWLNPKNFDDKGKQIVSLKEIV